MNSLPKNGSRAMSSKQIDITYLNGPDVERLALSDDEVIAAVESALAAQGRGETVIEPRVHLIPESSAKGHFNILRGYVKPLGVAGVKIVSDFVDNYKSGLPSEMALLNLFDPDTGMPLAVIDATAITDMRTGAMTALGARHLARSNSRILGHIGARGTAYWNVRLLDRLFDFDEIRVHSRRPESRDAFAARLSRDLGKPVKVTADWESCVRGADIVVEASRLPEPAPLLKTAWIGKGAFVVPYGTMSAVELSLTDIMDKIIVDDWGQCRKGLPFGALRAHVDSDRLTEQNLHAELGQVVAGIKPGRERDDETILFWHRGLSISDIALGHALLEKAKRASIGQTLRLSLIHHLTLPTTPYV
jgi:alanine dehydrogenase